MAADIDFETQDRCDRCTEIVSVIKSNQEMAENEPDSISESGNVENSTKSCSDIKAKQEIDENVDLSASEEGRNLGQEKNGSMSGINKKEMAEDEMDSVSGSGNGENNLESVSESALGHKKMDSMSCEEGFGSIEEQQYKEDDKPESIYAEVKKMSDMIKDDCVNFLEEDEKMVFGFEKIGYRKFEESSKNFSVIKEKQDLGGTEVDGEKIVFKICDESEGDSSEINKSLKIIEEENLRRCDENLETFTEIKGKNETAEIKQSKSSLEIKEVQETLISNNEKTNGFKAFEKLVKSSAESSEKQETTEILVASMAKPGGDGRLKKKGFICCKERPEGSLKKKTKQDKVETEKCLSKKGKDVKNGSETNGLSFIFEPRNLSKRSYSRSQMEALRFVNEEEQKKWWKGIYRGLGSVVAQELSELAVAKHHQKQGHKNVDRRQRQQRSGKKKETATIFGEECSENMGKRFEGAIPVDIACADGYIDGKESCTVVEEECNDEENSDDEYDSIQRPAFLVEGEPDFESGPPQDGLEYLRRVRWEAEQIPKVKVAKLNRSKLNREQTAYMPVIPDISKCPEHLTPSKHWEDAFLADFSKLRQAFSRIENSSTESSYDPPAVTTFSEDFNEGCGDPKQPKDIPSVSGLLAMDAVSRASMLRKRVNSLESSSMLSKDDCEWLFALCAAVDIPLNAEMSASMRCLLRKCATLRAAKLELDDEVIMLNMLVAIAGRFFRQSES